MQISRKLLIFMRVSSISMNLLMDFHENQIVNSIVFIILSFQFIEVIVLFIGRYQSIKQNQFLSTIIITPLMIELQIQIGYTNQVIIGTLYLEWLFFSNDRKNTYGMKQQAFYLVPCFIIVRLFIIMLKSQNYAIIIQIYLLVIPFLFEILQKKNQKKNNREDLLQIKNEIKTTSPVNNKDDQELQEIIQKKHIEASVQNPISLVHLESGIVQIQKPKQSNLDINIKKSMDSISSVPNNGFFQQILNLLPHGCIVLNLQCEVVYRNLKLIKMFQTSNEEEVLKLVSNLIKGSKIHERKKKKKTFLSGKIIPFIKNHDWQRYMSQNQFDDMKKQDDLKCIEDLIYKSKQFSISQQSNYERQSDTAKMSSFLNMSYVVRDDKEGIQNYKIKVYNNMQGGSNSNSYMNQIFTLIIVKNVSKKKELKKLKKQYRFQNQLLESFSHELRTPLNCSIQSIQAVIEIGTSRQIESLLNSALGSNYLLLHQINDILDTAAIETQNFQYNWCDFTIQEIINEITSIYSESLKIKSITLQPKSNRQDLYTKIKSDKARISQILINLMNNSIKFTREGGSISFYTEVMVQSDSSRCIKFELIDNGMGIDQEKLQKIMTTLNLESSPKTQNSDRNNNFMGLGLTVCSKLAEGLTKQVEGNLIIKSQPFKGTSVSFFVDDHRSDQFLSSNYVSYKSNKKIKLEYNAGQKSIQDKNFQSINRIFQSTNRIEIDESALILQNQSKFEKDYEAQIKVPEINLCFEKINHQKQQINSKMDKYLGIVKKKISEQICKNCTQILIVDDVPFNHIALKAMLSACYLQSDSAHDGMQALEMVQSRVKNHCQTYQLILMDIEMPNWDGFQTTFKIRQFLSQELKQASHIIMCSAYDSADNVEKAAECGMSGFLFKPVKAENLKRTLQKYNLFRMR